MQSDVTHKKNHQSDVPSDQSTSRRLSAKEREKKIVAGAIEFFARHGFEATTRHLARELGITQPLLYRYFPSKEVLIERVYEEVFMRRWNPEWEQLILDRTRPMEDRLIDFYTAYASAVYDFIWVRIFVYSGLKGIDINARYLAIVRERVLEPICRELRHSLGLPNSTKIPLSEVEVELAWSLHGAFFYRAIRRYVYAMPVAASDSEVIANNVRTFLEGSGKIHKQLVTRNTSKKSPD